MFVITGATGNIGSKAAENLLARGEKVRVIGRDSEKLAFLVGKGAEAAVGDMKDTAFLTRAFADVDAVFAMIPPNHAAADFRVYQNEIGASIANAITKAGVGYVVNLSSQGAERLNGLTGVNVLHLRPTYFMENLMMNIPLINQMGIAGSAIRGDQRFAMIATRDIAARVAEHLVKREFTGKVVHDLLGQRDLTLEEAISIIGRKIGWPDLKYVQFPYDGAVKGMQAMGISPSVSRLYIEMSMALNDGLFAVGRKRTAENTTPTSIEDFAGIFAAAFEPTKQKKAA